MYWYRWPIAVIAVVGMRGPVVAQGQAGDAHRGQPRVTSPAVVTPAPKLQAGNAAPAQEGDAHRGQPKVTVPPSKQSQPKSKAQ